MKIEILFSSVCVLLATLYVQGQEPNEGDVQFWNETKVYFKSYKKNEKKILQPHFIGVVRTGQNLKHFVQQRVGFGVDVRINKYLKFTPSYLYIAGQPIKNVQAFENRLRFDLTASKKWKNWAISDRNRYEHRRINNIGTANRYRNKIKLSYEFKNDEDKEIVTPFASTEPHYSFTKNVWSKNEAAIGVGKKFSKSTSAEFFYLLQNNKSTRLTRIHAIGVNLKFTVD